MFAHSNFKRCMVISGVIILAHAALSRMGLLAHRSPRAQQPWQMPTSLCDGLKRRCSHELPAARPFGASPTPSPANPVARRSGRHACSQVLPSVGPPIQSPANPVSCPLGRQPARPSAHLSGCATSIDGLSATDSGLRRSHLSDRLADVARRLRRTQGFTVPTFS